jgi:PBP1b-binding outer membrane lipoprotein LpoB
LLITGLWAEGEMTMKKIALVAVAGLALTAAACSKPAEEANTEADAMTATEEPMAVETPAADAMATETPAADAMAAETPAATETPAM